MSPFDGACQRCLDLGGVKRGGVIARGKECDFGCYYAPPGRQHRGGGEVISYRASLGWYHG